MTERGWSGEEVRAAAEELAGLLATDPGSVTPGAAGAVGHARMSGLDPGAEDPTARLDVPIALLRHGIVFAPHDERLGAWMLSLATALGLRDERDEAGHWAERAAAFPYADAEEADGTLLECAAILLERAKAVPGAFGDLPDALGGLAERCTLPEAKAAVRARQARAFTLRWYAERFDDDLRDALDLFAANIPLIPGHDPFRIDDLTLFAEVCRQGHLLGRTAPLDDAIKAIETVISEEDLPEHRRRLALLLDLRHPGDEGPVRDRIIDSLARAVEGDDRDDWEWYAYLLLERGRANGDADDLRTATRWLARYLGHQDPADPDAWLPWAAIAETHYELHLLTGDTAHADQVVACTTRALTYPLPDRDDGYRLMRNRLAATLHDAKRADLAQVVAAHPVKQWLTSAQDLVDAELAAGPLSESAAWLAGTVGAGWIRLAAVAPHQVITELADSSLFRDIVRMLRAVVGVPGNAEYRTAMEAFVELVAKLGEPVDGDGHGTFPATKTALDDPALDDLPFLAGMRSSLVDLVGVLNAGMGDQTQVLSLLDTADSILGDEGGRLARTPEDQREKDGLRAFYRLKRFLHTNPDLRGIREEAHAAWRVLSTVPDIPTMAPMVELVGSLHRLVEAYFTDLPPEPERRDFWLEHVLAPLRLGERVSGALRRSDPAAIRDVLARLDRMAAEPPRALLGFDPVEVVRVVAYGALSTLEPGNRTALELAVKGGFELWDKRSSELDWTFEVRAMAFARLLRRRDAVGDRAFARQVGRRVLSATSWRVLAQSGGEHALEMARNAGSMVDELTAWCVRDGAIDDLVAVVDARRALVLKAANTGRTVADQLRAVGRPDLAERWTAADGRDETLLPDWQEPDDDWGALRRTVLNALADHSDGLIDQPPVKEIRNALRTHGSGCLVYLLPANEHHGGMALLVPARGRPRVRPLPDLRVDTAVERYRVAYEARDERPDEESVARWRAELGELCTWAWGAAGGELSRIGGRYGRLVLVPVGSLGLVPWHAARRTVDGADRYLVQDMPVSYVPSARLFCDLVGRAEVGPGRAVLVGNPARDLPTGAYEAKAIRDVFYPGGAFLGGFGQARWRAAEDGMGTAEQVLAGLRSPLPVLHLACHAVADMRRPLRSEVRLATGPLSARQLLDHSRTALLPLGLVNLAGCRTNVSGIDYDEALSLSTTFLAIGARTVIGSLWRVPSGRTTAHLMFLFYHYLLVERRPPADALRAAQLWMLDPGRAYPDSMPPEIRALAPSADFDYADVECWAGFTQQGR